MQTTTKKPVGRYLCEICGKEIKPPERVGIPPFLFCTECREKLRDQGLGPIQLFRRRKVSDLIRSIIKHEYKR